jgi:hypothetical protein
MNCPGLASEWNAGWQSCRPAIPRAWLYTEAMLLKPTKLRESDPPVLHVAVLGRL